MMEQKIKARKIACFWLSRWRMAPQKDCGPANLFWISDFQIIMLF